MLISDWIPILNYMGDIHLLNVFVEENFQAIASMLSLNRNSEFCSWKMDSYLIIFLLNILEGASFPAITFPLFLLLGDTDPSNMANVSVRRFRSGIRAYFVVWIGRFWNAFPHSLDVYWQKLKKIIFNWKKNFGINKSFFLFDLTGNINTFWLKSPP